jgi:hypothetical protein
MPIGIHNSPLAWPVVYANWVNVYGNWHTQKPLAWLLCMPQWDVVHAAMCCCVCQLCMPIGLVCCVCQLAYTIAQLAYKTTRQMGCCVSQLEYTTCQWMGCCVCQVAYTTAHWHTQHPTHWPIVYANWDTVYANWHVVYANGLLCMPIGIHNIPSIGLLYMPIGIHNNPLANGCCVCQLAYTSGQWMGGIHNNPLS